MQPRLLALGFALVSTGLAQDVFTKLDTTRPPTRPSSAVESCTATNCLTLTNKCGVTYGGCYTACPGHTIPLYTSPPCPTTTTAAPSTTLSSSTACPTVCWDLINECGQMYGGCRPVCNGLMYDMPSFSKPPCPSSTTMPSIAAPSPATITPTVQSRVAGSVIFNTTKSCNKIVCWDYQNSCGLKYGGCHADCEGMSTPSYTDPGCPTKEVGNTKGFVTTRSSDGCGWTCPQYADNCGNIFGPGCFTSCPGVAPPSFTTPYCETGAVATEEAMVTTAQ